MKEDLNFSYKKVSSRPVVNENTQKGDLDKNIILEFAGF